MATTALIAWVRNQRVTSKNRRAWDSASNITACVGATISLCGLFGSQIAAQLRSAVDKRLSRFVSVIDLQHWGLLLCGVTGWLGRCCGRDSDGSRLSYSSAVGAGAQER